MTSQMKTDVVLVNPLVEREGAGDHQLKKGLHTPPEGLCYLAACLREVDLDVSIIDATALNLPARETVRRTLAFEPRLVGLTATTVSVGSAAGIAGMIKTESPNCTTVIGGPHVTLMPEETLLRFPCFDIAVIGEGERTFTELVCTLDNGRWDLEGIRGLAFRRNGKIIQTEQRPFIEDLDSLPLPAWDLLGNLRSNYRQSVARSHTKHSIGIVTSRGCPGKCRFCARAVFGNRLRAFSADRVLELFSILEKDHNMDGVVINDDNFVVFKKRLRRICGELSKRRKKFLWSCFARVDHVDRETLGTMYAGGCRSISFGIESGNQAILDAMGKGISLGQIERAVFEARRAGLFTTGYFILGYPGETPATIEDTIAFAGALPLDNVLYSYATPYPGTEFYDMVAGSREIEWNRFNQWQVTYVPEGMTEQDLRKYVAKGTASFYMRPSIWMRHARRALHEGLVLPYIREALPFLRHSLKTSPH